MIIRMQATTNTCILFQKEQWTLHEDESGDTGVKDEELYVNGHTVVWSRGGQDGCRSVVKTFTLDTPVIQVLLWNHFYIVGTKFHGLMMMKIF